MTHNRNGSPPISGGVSPAELHHIHNHKQALSSFAFFVRVAIGSLLLVGCLLVTFAIPPTAQVRGKAIQKKSFMSKYYASNPTARRDGKAVAKNGGIQYAPIDLELPKFPTLKQELERSEVVVLYFAAKWCKMSAPVTRLIDLHLMPSLRDSEKLPAITKRPFSLIYVSSDTSKIQYKAYSKMRSWTKVPFQSTPERRNLKKYFKVCAKMEMEKLQLQREHELPFLVVLSGKTHKIVSKQGVEDLKEKKSEVLDYWLDLVRARGGNTGVQV